ncbi:MAG: aminotransferase class IV [Deltaproteobacteria bacterium]|nr:aminotransferase class IV [Deltaproteobacteria bacterium]
MDDRGFQFGDGVYEVLYGLDGRPFLLREHMDRLKRSLEGLRIRGVDLAEVEKVILVLAAKVRPRSKVYVSITRGTAPRNHTFPVGAKPNIVATVREAPVAPETYLRDGIKAVCVPDRRWGRCDLKTLNLLGNVLARQEAEEAGAQEAILYGPDEIVREGSSANVFAVIEGVICTHPWTSVFCRALPADC